MKSFKNHYNRSRSVLPLLNGSFDTPILPILTFSYYLTASQKRDFVWIGGGNNLNNLGPVLINGFNSWNFILPFPKPQIVRLQANSFIEKSLFLNAGTYNLSFSYSSRSGSQINPINSLMMLLSVPHLI